jgi:hypothetical protein
LQWKVSASRLIVTLDDPALGFSREIAEQRLRLFDTTPRARRPHSPRLRVDAAIFRLKPEATAIPEMKEARSTKG